MIGNLVLGLAALAGGAIVWLLGVPLRARAARKAVEADRRTRTERANRETDTRIDKAVDRAGTGGWRDRLLRHRDQ